MKQISLNKVETWGPHPSAMPVTAKTRAGRFVIKGNGTRTCCGGWQFVFTGVHPGQGYRFRTSVRHEGLENPVDQVVRPVQGLDLGGRLEIDHRVNAVPGLVRAA